MKRTNKTRGVFSLATGGWLLVGLFLLLSGIPQVVQADPGELFVSPDGTGTACTQATPCTLQTALDIAETNGEDDVIYLEPGIYGRVAHAPENAKSLVIRGEPGTAAQDIILDSVGTGTALYLRSSGTVGSVTITGLTIQGGNWSGLDVYCENGSLGITVTGVIIQNNMTYHDGGGIEINAGIDATGQGNGVVTMEIRNSIIRGNQALKRGGGIAAHSCVQGNTLGGGGPQDLHVGEWGRGNATVNAYYSDIGDVSIDTSRGEPTYDYVSVISEDPAFVDPANDDHHLTSSSPCIDAGTTAVPVPPGLPTTDFEGDPRVLGAAPDVGADEHGYMRRIYLPLVTKSYL